MLIQPLIYQQIHFPKSCSSKSFYNYRRRQWRSPEPRGHAGLLLLQAVPLEESLAILPLPVRGSLPGRRNGIPRLQW